MQKRIHTYLFVVATLLLLFKSALIGQESKSIQDRLNELEGRMTRIEQLLGASKVVQPSQIDMTGFWSGRASDETGPGTLTLNIRQIQGTISGAATILNDGSQNAWQGTVSGKVAQNQLDGEINVDINNCIFKMNFSAQSSGDSLVGKFVGTYPCRKKIISDGIFTLTKQANRPSQPIALVNFVIYRNGVQLGTDKNPWPLRVKVGQTIMLTAEGRDVGWNNVTQINPTWSPSWPDIFDISPTQGTSVTIKVLQHKDDAFIDVTQGNVANRIDIKIE